MELTFGRIAKTNTNTYHDPIYSIDHGIVGLVVIVIKSWVGLHKKGRQEVKLSLY